MADTISNRIRLNRIDTNSNFSYNLESETEYLLIIARSNKYGIYIVNVTSTGVVKAHTVAVAGTECTLTVGTNSLGITTDENNTNLMLIG